MRRSLRSIGCALAVALASTNADASCSGGTNFGNAGSCAVAPAPLPRWWGGTALTPSSFGSLGDFYVVQGTGEIWTETSSGPSDLHAALKYPGDCSMAALQFYATPAAPASTSALGNPGDIAFDNGGDVYAKSSAGWWQPTGLMLSGVNGNAAGFWSLANYTPPSLGSTPGAELACGGVLGGGTSSLQTGATTTADSSNVIAATVQMTPVSWGTGISPTIRALASTDSWEIFVQSGKLNVVDRDASGYEASAFPLPTGTTFYLGAAINKSAGAVFEFGLTVPAGSAIAATSPDGKTWAQLGATQSGLRPAAFATTTGALSIGDFAGSGGTFSGLIISASVQTGWATLISVSLVNYSAGVASVSDSSASGLSWAVIGATPGG